MIGSGISTYYHIASKLFSYESLLKMAVYSRHSSPASECAVNTCANMGHTVLYPREMNEEHPVVSTKHYQVGTCP
jgi:hypothetical protein